MDYPLAIVNGEAWKSASIETLMVSGTSLQTGQLRPQERELVKEIRELHRAADALAT